MRWSEAQGQLRPLFVALGREGSRPTPEYPFVALAGTRWWELADAGAEAPRAHGSVPLRWLKEHDPRGGLPVELHDRLTADPVVRAEVVRALLDRFFHDGPAAEARQLTGLDDSDPAGSGAGGTSTAGGSPGRDPAWAWDELVLACDLVARNGWHELPSENPLVVELSEVLRSLPVHPTAVRGPKFRSPSSVRRKMADIATRHPDSVRRHTNGGRLDREVLQAFLDRPQEMHACAAQLRAGVAAGDFDDLPDADEVVDDEGAAREGRLLERRHLRRERDPRLRRKKLAEALREHGALRCEVCGFDFHRAYGARGEGYAECHHVVPLHVSGETTTKLQDLAVLCANCHRMVHRGTRWLTPAELRGVVEAQRANAATAERQPGAPVGSGGC
ncbi:HNH endonuclease [Saccharothrix algeriensis]|uniref:5-methylcytosine-specific restriction endonuclease McrA n=2 Tax=Saccharothrix algeriensis TaxID=173560 RepID=A0ABS2SIH6_9PSEU|nr:HNH endonuclease [Saccharothrix algeriensis]MBM7814871.1 5-methylcytosine-specific restriction endonuclease McrA [Saccharothrix algeriensis]